MGQIPQCQRDLQYIRLQWHDACLSSRHPDPGGVTVAEALIHGGGPTYPCSLGPLSSRVGIRPRARVRVLVVLDSLEVLWDEHGMGLELPGRAVAT